MAGAGGVLDGGMRGVVWWREGRGCIAEWCGAGLQNIWKFLRYLPGIPVSLLQWAGNKETLLVTGYGQFVVACYLYNRTRVNTAPLPLDDKSKRDRERVAQEGSEGAAARRLLEDYLNMPVTIQHCPDLGGRLQKYWTKTSVFGIIAMVTIAPVPKNCPLILDDVTLSMLNEILQTLKHPNITTMFEVRYVPSADDTGTGGGHVITTQRMQDASLRDLIYKSRPLDDWSVKYPEPSDESCRAHPLPAKMVACYGRQILEAMSYLYEQDFPALGHIHTGNVFVSRDDVNMTCQLGGYDNTLLGYRPRRYKAIADAGMLERMDVVMFGHVMYEIACGREVGGAVPLREEYQLVADDKVRNILEKIFKLKMNNKAGVAKMLKWNFFAQAKVDAVQPNQCRTLPKHLKKFLVDNYGPKRKS